MTTIIDDVPLISIKRSHQAPSSIMPVPSLILESTYIEKECINVPEYSIPSCSGKTIRIYQNFSLLLSYIALSRITTIGNVAYQLHMLHMIITRMILRKPLPCVPHHTHPVTPIISHNIAEHDVSFLSNRICEGQPNLAKIYPQVFGLVCPTSPLLVMVCNLVRWSKHNM